MQYRDFENWSISRDQLVQCPTAWNKPLAVVEHTGDVERAAFATVWNIAAKRAAFDALIGEV